MQRIHRISLFTGLLLFAAAAALATPTCYTSYGGTKPNKLYLYFPLTADSTYPEFGIPNGAPATSPAHAFNISDLPSYHGNVADLRNAVYDVVADDYCEFNVQVILTTAKPPTTFPRRNTVAIGTDDGTSAGGLFGLAQAVDTNDATAVDFAHEWAATYQGLYGGAGGALNGANSTLARWANAIGGTASHEAGHNYGLSHDDGLVVAAGEDPLTHHIMASGSHYSGEDRAGYRRHFSDHEYSLLASNVGLSVQTLWNWDFVNPNQQTASKVTIDFLSTQSSLAVTGPYNGPESPWINPTVSASLGTQVFKGVTYHQFRVTWSTGHAWNGKVPTGPGPTTGVSGQVAGGASFHVGTGFTGIDYNTSSPVIITNVTLYSGATALVLHPRGVSFNSGVADTADGAFNVEAMNIAGAQLRVDEVKVHLLPRLLSIDSMVGAPPLRVVANPRLDTEASAAQLSIARLTAVAPTAVAAKQVMTPFVDVRGEAFQAWSAPRVLTLAKSLQMNESLTIPIAKLSDARHVVINRTASDCAKMDRLVGKDVGTCKPGIAVDLFPATSVYMTAAVTDPASKHWDYATQKYVTTPLTSHVFLQIVGTHPDLNHNGIDDYLDIATKKFKDTRNIGIPDQVIKE